MNKEISLIAYNFRILLRRWHYRPLVFRSCAPAMASMRTWRYFWKHSRLTIYNRISKTFTILTCQTVRSVFFPPMLQEELARKYRTQATQNQIPPNWQLLMHLITIHHQFGFVVFRCLFHCPDGCRTHQIFRNVIRLPFLLTQRQVLRNIDFKRGAIFDLQTGTLIFQSLPQNLALGFVQHLGTGKSNAVRYHPLNLFQDESQLRTKDYLVWNSGLAATVTVGISGLYGQVQIVLKEGIKVWGSIYQMYSDNTVFDLTGITAMLTPNIVGLVASSDIASIVPHADAVWTTLMDGRILLALVLQIAADDHQDCRMQNIIPEHLLCINQSSLDAVTFANLDCLPMVSLLGHCFRIRESSAFLTSPATRTFPRRFRQIKNLGIALETRDNRGTGNFSTGQRGVNPVSNRTKLPFGEPMGYFGYHRFDQIDVSRTIFAVQPHIDRQSQRFPAPEWLKFQDQDHQVQTPSINRYVSSRTTGIPPVPMSVNFLAVVGNQGVVQGQGNNAISIEYCNLHLYQYSPKRCRAPRYIRKEAMVGIVIIVVGWIGKGDDARNVSPSCTQNSVSYQPNINLVSQCGESWGKLLKKFRPCRNKCIHLDFPVLTMYPINTVIGRNIFIDKPLKLVA